MTRTPAWSARLDLLADLGRSTLSVDFGIAKKPSPRDMAWHAKWLEAVA